MTTPTPGGGSGRSPAGPAGDLPASAAPIVARYTPGPLIDVQHVEPSDVTWANARTYLVTDPHGQQYRALRVYVDGALYGYWAVELMPAALDFGDVFEVEREQSVAEYDEARRQAARDARRRRYRRGTHA